MVYNFPYHALVKKYRKNKLVFSKPKKMMDLMDENQSSVRQFTGYGRIKFFTCFEFLFEVLTLHLSVCFYLMEIKKKRRWNWRPVDFCSSRSPVFNFNRKSMKRNESRDLLRPPPDGFRNWTDLSKFEWASIFFFFFYRFFKRFGDKLVGR